MSDVRNNVYFIVSLIPTHILAPWVSDDGDDSTMEMAMEQLQIDIFMVSQVRFFLIFNGQRS